MTDTRNYIQGRYLDYYTSTEFEFNPLFNPTNDIEWGYTTKNGEIYRHLNSTEMDVSITDMRENNGFGVYHSLTEYEESSESSYTQKQPTLTRIGITLHTKSSQPTQSEWNKLISMGQETKSTLEKEFPLDFNVIRTAFNQIILISDPHPFDMGSNLHSRVESYVIPDQLGSFDITSITPSGNGLSGTSSVSSQLSESVQKYVIDKYKDIQKKAVEALNGEDISRFSSPDDEEFPEEAIGDEFYDLLDELQDIDQIASKKSFQFIKGLVNRDDDITAGYITNTTFNCRTISRHYATEYLSNNWLGDRSQVNISVMDLYGLIPCIGSISPQGGFYVYEEEINNIDRFPTDNLVEFYEDNMIKISLTEGSINRLEDIESNIALDLDMQEIEEDVGLFLLASGFAEKEPEV